MVSIKRPLPPELRPCRPRSPYPTRRGPKDLDDVELAECVDDRLDGREHLLAVATECHDAVCVECKCWITLDPDGVELGHYRSQRSDRRPTCPHRPEADVDPARRLNARIYREGGVDA